LKVSSKGAQSKDDQGRLPRHHACRNNASERGIKTLLTIYPRAAQVKDDQEKLPIHYACQNEADTNIIHMLTKTHPVSINIKNSEWVSLFWFILQFINSLACSTMKGLDIFRGSQSNV